MLAASGWRPDCSLASEVNITEILPCRQSPQRFYFPCQGARESMDPELLESADPGHRKWAEGKGVEVKISASTSFQDRFGLSAARVHVPNEVPNIQIWTLGTDMVSASPRSFVLDGSLFHALMIAEEFLTTSSNKWDFIYI